MGVALIAKSTARLASLGRMLSSLRSTWGRSHGNVPVRARAPCSILQHLAGARSLPRWEGMCSGDVNHFRLQGRPNLSTVRRTTWACSQVVL